MSVNLFIPCFIDQLAPHLGWRLVELLTRLRVPWRYPEDQTCCGQFALTLGDPDTARRLMRHFLRVFRGEENIICPSASCTFMVRHYYPRLAQGEKERQEVAALTGRTWEVGEWLAARGSLPWTPHYSEPLVLHRSCKASRLGVLPQTVDLLSQVAALELREASPYYSCCGFGGVFKVQHPEISRKIGLTYLDAVQATGAFGLVSPDYSCLLHLKGLAKRSGLTLKFFHVLEILLRPPVSPGEKKE